MNFKFISCNTDTIIYM